MLDVLLLTALSLICVSSLGLVFFAKRKVIKRAGEVLIIVSVVLMGVMVFALPTQVEPVVGLEVPGAQAQS